MPKGARESFRVEILPDLLQRKSLRRALEAAGSVRRRATDELIRQYNTIGLFQSEQEVLRTVLEDGMSDGLGEAAVRHAVKEAYEAFQVLVASARGGEISVRRRLTPATVVEVPKEDVVFAVTDRSVRIPYVGVVRYRNNQFITAGMRAGDAPRPENVQWLWANVTRVCVGAQASVHFLLIDCREEGAPIAQPKVRRRARRLPDLLK